MNNSVNRQENPSNFDSNELPYLLRDDNAQKLLDQRERELWLAYGLNRAQVMARMGMLEREIERQRVKWACISAESQRPKKTESGIYYECKIYDNLTTISPKFERDTPPRPPDNSGNQIQKFSKRSRKRLMNRARRLNKSGLPLPFFVTLTYHKNLKDPIAAKKHLNTFFQRWRRRSSEFAYFWKMEPQKRGAVHFHLAMFIPEGLQDDLKMRLGPVVEAKGKERTVLNCMREQVQNDWAEVTKEVDGIDVPFTRFDYIRKRKYKAENYRVRGHGRTVKTRCANPRLEYKIEPDFEHRFYGTNVRTAPNWKAFLGYMYKYMEKEIRENPFGEGVPTGRFWGFSYNLDFEHLCLGIVDHKHLENVNDFANALNALSFARTTEHLTHNAKRKKKELRGEPDKLERELNKYRAIFEKQKKRYLMQKDKIKAGYGLQFEIHNEVSLSCEKYLRSKSVGEFFNFP